MSELNLDPAKVAIFWDNLDSRCQPLIAPHGFRGHCVYRILASHKEVWWDSSVMNWDKKPNYPPLCYPKKGSWVDTRLDRNKRINYVTAHTTMYNPRSFSKYPLQHVIDYYNNQGSLQSFIYCTLDFIYHMSRPCIWLYTSDMHAIVEQRFLLFKKDYIRHPNEYAKDRLKLMRNPHSNAFNIDIHKLFSTNDDIFESEYMNIVNHFNFTSNINDVRSFMLTYLEREQSVAIL